MKLPYSINPSDISTFDVLICTDTHSLSMLGSLKNKVEGFKGVKIAIDHHAKSISPISTKTSFIKPDYLSTAQLVYELIIQSKLKLTPKAAASIATGIIADSAGFLIGDAKTFRVLGEVLEKSHLSYSEVLSLFSLQMDISEKVAQLKSAHRNKIFNSNNHLIVTTQVGHFEASAANYSVFGGADVAFAAGKDKDGLILSSRASSPFVEKYKFHLTKHVLQPLQKEFGGSAGGHAGAAAYNAAQGNLDVLLQRCVELTHNFINTKTHSSKGLKQY